MNPVKANIGVGICGGTGYGAGELLRLLVGHPSAEVVSVTTTSQIGQPISSAHPFLNGFYDLCFDAEMNLEKLGAYKQQVLFLALPSGLSAGVVEGVRKRLGSTLKVVDLSGDFRLSDKALHERYYPESPFAPELRSKFVLGIPEINCSEIAEAECVANSGCHVATSVLAAAPLMALGLRGALCIDSKTGSSGGGRQASDAFHHPARNANTSAYKVLQHRHEPEIQTLLSKLAGNPVQTQFVPQLLPVSRGIFVTVYAELEQGIDTAELMERYRSFYSESAFVRVVDGSPELRNVVGSNFCDISVVARENRVVAMAALDNLGKGMAGQAIQSMNIMCSLPETTGLWKPALGLV